MLLLGWLHVAGCVLCVARERPVWMMPRQVLTMLSTTTMYFELLYVQHRTSISNGLAPVSGLDFKAEWRGLTNTTSDGVSPTSCHAVCRLADYAPLSTVSPPIAQNQHQETERRPA